jgi:hypothetical protein
MQETYKESIQRELNELRFIRQRKYLKLLQLQLQIEKLEQELLNNPN